MKGALSYKPDIFNYLYNHNSKHIHYITWADIWSSYDFIMFPAGTWIYDANFPPNIGCNNVYPSGVSQDSDLNLEN